MRTMISLLVFCLLTVSFPQAIRGEQVVLFLGDSLTAGLGVTPEEAYPHLVGEKLARDGISGVRIVNGGLSGATTAGALARLQWYERIRPDVLFLALGANDGLRGLDIGTMQDNLEEVIRYAKSRDMTVLLAGMELPPNYGTQYTEAFRTAYRHLAEQYELVFIPFLLEGVGGVAALNQADGIHPNAEGHVVIAHHVYPSLKQLLEHNQDRYNRGT
ncbi:arylesterase [Desulfobulbus alkaliphilus]|uniref:arylesterase n=1 Tax=Desulfobulbus alkaliphilus TaxID=869814 RepID=UPI0019656616|nr:arylesterase [Desulfobulbus alkaliphilus]MBM9538075.1 arylesterase [Desulfobulbus alkaliphilus]